MKQIPEEMTAADAAKEYQDNKEVFIVNNGNAEAAGIECVSCAEVFKKQEMRYCKCEEALICEKCCNHCGYNDAGECMW